MHGCQEVVKPTSEGEVVRSSSMAVRGCARQLVPLPGPGIDTGSTLSASSMTGHVRQLLPYLTAYVSCYLTLPHCVASHTSAVVEVVV